MYEVVGFEEINFTNQNTGELINGVRFHLVSDDQTSSIKNGREVTTQFFTMQKIKGVPTVGAISDLKFSVKNGKAVITGIEIIS